MSAKTTIVRIEPTYRIFGTSPISIVDFIPKEDGMIHPHIRVAGRNVIDLIDFVKAEKCEENHVEFYILKSFHGGRLAVDRPVYMLFCDARDVIQIHKMSGVGFMVAAWDKRFLTKAGALQEVQAEMNPDHFDIFVNDDHLGLARTDLEMYELLRSAFPGVTKSKSKQIFGHRYSTVRIVGTGYNSRVKAT